MKLPYPFSTLWFWHSLCCLLTLLSCVAILWPQVYLPDAWEARIISYAGSVALCSMFASLLLFAVVSISLLLHLHYRRALVQLLHWAGQWGLSVGVFALLAWLANVPPPQDGMAEAQPTQATDAPMTPGDVLFGPNALFIPFSQELLSSMEVETVARAPHLTHLESDHSDLLESYLSRSPRWAALMDDDTFYSKPGHVVMSPMISDGNAIQGLVHVAFRHLVEGDPIPAGYTIIKPGDPMPARPEGSEQVADLALDLGRSHYLLLAWRGTSHTETAHRAINAAITTVDAMVQPLDQEPSGSTLQRMLEGKRNLIGDAPCLLLSQPPAQYGAYQAEIYVNPGELGTLLLRVAEAQTDTPLKLFHCPARFSANTRELFRHDIPGTAAAQHSSTALWGNIPGLLPEKAPLFAIKSGEAHQFFDVAFELWFQPASALKKRRLLLRRLYSVQACEALTTPQSPAAADEDTAAEAPDTEAQ